MAKKTRKNIFAFLGSVFKSSKAKALNGGFSILNSISYSQNNYVDFNSYQLAARQISAIGKSCSVIANYVKKTQWNIYDQKEKVVTGGQDLNKLQLLLKKPNEFMTWVQMLGFITWDLLITGNAFILKDQLNGKGQPLELHRLYPQFMVIKSSKTVKIVNYGYRLAGQPEVLYDPSEIIHLTLDPDMQRETWGVGKVQGSENSVQYASDLQSFRQKFLENGAVPSGILSTDQSPNDMEVQRITDMWRANFSGQKNAGKTPVLIAGTKYQTIGLSGDQMQYLEDKKFNMQEIFMIFGVPPIMTGLDPEKIKYDNAFEQRRIFMEGTIQPILNIINEGFTNELASLYGDLVFSFLDVTGAKDPEVIVKLLERGVITINEAREQTGFKVKTENKELDIHFVPMNWMPVDMVTGFSSPALVAPGGKPPEEGKGVLPASRFLASVPNGKARGESWRDKASGGWESTPVSPDGIWRIKDFSSDENIRRIQLDFLRLGRQSQIYKTTFGLKLAETFLASQVERIMANFDALKLDKAYDKKSSKAEAAKIAKQIVVLETENALLLTAFNPVWQSLADKGVNDVSSILTFEVDPEIVRSDVAKRVNVMRATGPRVNEVTLGKVQNYLTAGIEAGETQVELGKRLRDSLENVNASRAQAIARNEISEAYRQGARSGLQSSGVVTHVSVVGCEAQEIGSPEYAGSSTCNINDVPIKDINKLNYHVNHTGMEVPSQFIGG